MELSQLWFLQLLQVILQAIWTLGKFMIASYAALLTMYVIHLIILAIMGINPIRYVKNT